MHRDTLSIRQRQCTVKHEQAASPVEPMPALKADPTVKPSPQAKSKTKAEPVVDKLELAVKAEQVDQPKLETVSQKKETVTMGDIDVNDDDDDPIVAEYDVFIKPQMVDGRQILVLQFPNREKSKPYDAKNGSAPLELRIKPNAGMVEIDVPLDVRRNFDREKGIKWGEAMNKSNLAKGGGSHGMAGGFGVGSAVPPGRGRGRGEAEEAEHREKLLANYPKAVEDGHVLQTQTLGGQFAAKNSTTPQYMVGTFTNDQLHLTPVDQIVPMRPQFHHIDAAAEQERLTQARNAGAPRVTEARAIHMTVKSTNDGEEDHTNSMAQRIQAVQAEPWRRHRFVDAEEPEAWSFFQENFFAGGAGGQNTEELLKKVPKLVSGVSDEQYLDMVAPLRSKARLSKNKQAKARKDRAIKKEDRGKEAADGEEDDSSSSWSDISDGDNDDGTAPAAASAPATATTTAAAAALLQEF